MASELSGFQDRYSRRSKMPDVSHQTQPLGNFTKDDLDYAKNNKIIINPSEFLSQDKNDSLELVYINATYSKYPQPWNLTRFSQNETDKIIDYAISKEGNIILASNILQDIVLISQLIYEKSGLVIKGIYIQSLESKYEDKKWNDNKHLFNDSESLYDRYVVDIRGSFDFYQNHSIENAKNISLPDLTVMRDWELKELLKKDVVFVSYSPVDYEHLYNLLKTRGFNDFKYYEPGLKKHVKELGFHLTRPFLNQGKILSNEEAVENIFSRGNVKFICTDKITCSNLIPPDMVEKIMFEDIGKDNAKIATLSLSKEFSYIVLTYGLNSTGNDYHIGYWLTENNSTYLGSLIDYSSISEEFLDDYSSERDTLTAREYSDSFISSYDVGDYIKGELLDLSVEQVMFVIAAMIIVLKLAIFKVQRTVFIGEYKQISVKNKKMKSLLMLSPIVFVFLNASAYFLVFFSIFGLQIFPPSNINEILLVDSKYLSTLLYLIVMAHLYINSPDSKKRLAIIASIVSLVFLIDPFGIKELPFLVIGVVIIGEVTSFLLQSPFYIQYMKNKNLLENGISTGLMKGIEYPSKWKYLHETDNGFGFIVDLNNFSEKNVLRLTLRLNSDEVIVRSASSSENEDVFGGYYSSYNCQKSDVLIKMALIKESGCDFAIIQPLIVSEFFGAASSISKDGTGIHIAVGSGDSATEGNKDAKSYIQTRTRYRKTSIQKVIEKIEKKLDSPVNIEFSCDPSISKVKVLQVRRINDYEASSVIKIMPKSISDYILAEDFIAKCSPLSGEVIEYGTKSDYIYIDGYLYKKKKTALSFSYVNSLAVSDLSQSIDNLLEYYSNAPIASHQKAIVDLYSALDIYRKAYKLSQSALKESGVVKISHTYLCKTNGSHELNINDDYQLMLMQDSPIEDTIREHVHLVIVKINAAIYFISSHLKGTVDDNLKLSDLILDMPSFKYSDHSQPLNESMKNVIVPGEITGVAWDASRISDEDILELKEIVKKHGKVCLVGSEVSPAWVHHFQYVSSIVSRFGHESSHLSISASSLEIPYKLESEVDVKCRLEKKS